MHLFLTQLDCRLIDVLASAVTDAPYFETYFL